MRLRLSFIYMCNLFFFFFVQGGFSVCLPSFERFFGVFRLGGFSLLDFFFLLRAERQEGEIKEGGREGERGFYLQE